MPINIDVNDIKKIIQSVKILKSATARGSISRLAKDSILQCPVIMSNNITADNAMIIAKALERQYASFFLTLFSVNSSIDFNKYGGVQGYLKSIHNNDGAPDLFSFGKDAIDTIKMLESNTSTTNNGPVVISEDVILECWNCVDDELNMNLLNDKYQPHRKYQKAIEDTLDNIDGLLNRGANRNPGLSGVQNTTTTTRPKSSTTPETKQTVINQLPYSQSTKAPTIVRNDKITMMEPTIMEVEFILHGAGAGNQSSVHKQTALIGIKSMVRMIYENTMVSNLCQSVLDNKLAYKFIKWTKGEYKIFRDLIFNITQSRQDAINQRTASRWFSALRRRRRHSKIFNTPNTKISPITTICVSSEEVEQVKNITGLDLREPNVARKFIEQTFLLAFIIFDSQTGIVDTMFDGFEEYESATISSLKTSNAKELDVSSMRDFMKMMNTRSL